MQRMSPLNPVHSLGEPRLELLAADGTPDQGIMKHLLDIFMVYFGCQFPFLDKADLEAKIDARKGNNFLLNCIAGISAR